MPNPVLAKAARLIAEIQLLETRAYTAAELAQTLGVHKRSIQRDLAALQAEPLYVPLTVDDEWRWRVFR